MDAVTGRHAAIVAACAVFSIAGCSAERAKERAQARHAALMEAIEKRDRAAVQRLGNGPIDIYATDKSGESPISAAEKSGQADILEALKRWRDPQKDLWRAQKAVETGTSIGLQPPKPEPEFNVHAKWMDEKRRAREEGRPEPTLTDLAPSLEEQINALPDGERKEWARRNLAVHLSQERNFERARSLIFQLKDPKMRIDALLYIGQMVPSGAEFLSHAGEIRSQIDLALDAAERDPYYAQLAHLQWLRGDPTGAKLTCAAIQADSYKTATCARL